MAPDNVPPYNKHLMGHSEFLHGSSMICFPLNISEKLKTTRRRKIIAFIFVNMIQDPRILKNNIDHVNKRGPLSFFHPDTNLVLENVLVHLVGNTHVVVVAVELIWLLCLNALSFNFVQTLNKSLRFRKFRRSNVHRSDIIQMNHYESCTTFLLHVLCSKWPHSFFLRLFVPNTSAFV